MKARKNRKGLILINTGDGKGKSTSSFGTIFRAAGWGLKICIIQFIKGQWQTGEQLAAKRFDNIDWYALGDGFTWDTKNPEQDIKTTMEIWEFAKEKIISKDYDIVLLDEINYCCDYGWLSGQEIAEFLHNSKAPWMHIILSGRNAAPEVIAIADTVTEMKKIKHAFDKGINAEQGIEF